MYVHGLNQFPQKVEPSETITWLDYLVLSNPQGVMKVLAKNGYTGYLSPQDQDEMVEACFEFINSHGDQAVVDLLKEHPLYDVIAGTAMEETKVVVPFKNASGEQSDIITTIRTINYKALAENVLVIIGALFLAGKLWGLLTKTD